MKDYAESLILFYASNQLGLAAGRVKPSFKPLTNYGQPQGSTSTPIPL
jgi:hypothetical protein